jgi:hypothetical protein
LKPFVFVNMLLRRVVFPDPKKPVTIVSGIFEVSLIAQQ